MGMINGDVADVKWVKTKPASAPERQNAAVANDTNEVPQGTGKMSRLKNWVKNAVNCCIE